MPNLYAIDPGYYELLAWVSTLVGSFLAVAITHTLAHRG